MQAAPEVFATAERWYCPQHGRHVQSRKTYRMASAPNVLVVYLRLMLEQDAYKLHLRVAFDELLEVVVHAAADSSPEAVLYMLSSVVVHTGETTRSGHARAANVPIAQLQAAAAAGVELRVLVGDRWTGKQPIDCNAAAIYPCLRTAVEALLS
jgi:hypothetical protein